MNKYLSATALVCLFASAPAFAQNSTATGTGVGVANSDSRSGAIAISGQGGQGGNSALTINNPAQSRVDTNATGDVTSRVIQSGTTTQRIEQSGGTTNRVVSSGSTSVKTAPSMVAPGLAAAGLETCLGSASGTVSLMGFGIGGGSTMTDEGCQARLDSRTLASYGLKAAAVARLCQRPDIWRSMPDICQQYWPVGMPLPYGIVVAAGPAQITMSSDSAGVIRVIDGRDGVEKDCLNYSHTKQKCYHWSGERPRPRQQVAHVAQPQRIVVKPKPKAKSADPAAEPPTP